MRGDLDGPPRRLGYWACGGPWDGTWGRQWILTWPKPMASTTGVLASKPKRADPSASEAAREPGSDAHKGHDSSGTRRGLRNGGAT